MIEQGIPSEPCVMRPDSTTVFSFPMKAPEGAITRDDVDAISHLKLWRVYQLHWCEHKPSVTISVNENEWPTVGAWVFDNFDICTGVSFLPMDGGTYRQAPYETCSKEDYESLLAKMPANINWDMLKENDDNVEGAQQLACVAGVCEI
jgi:ribonucleoside-diphosphate reductase alpha chain